MNTRLIVQRMSIPDKYQSFGRMDHWNIIRWIPLAPGRYSEVFNEWEVLILNSPDEMGVRSSSEDSGTIKLPSVAYSSTPRRPDRGLPYDLGCFRVNAPWFEQTVLNWNLEYGNNKNLTLEDVVWGPD